ncbi:hypothetical protein VYU27_006622 [Nannochloropsis oceanica]
MGAYLSTPITDKESEDGEGGHIRYGVSAMQGWRRSMEDAHVAVPALKGDERAAIFGVFDGHGGREVAHFVARHLVEEVVRRGEWGDGAYEEALRQSFHRMDDMLRQEEYDPELREYKAGLGPATTSAPAPTVTVQSAAAPAAPATAPATAAPTPAATTTTTTTTIEATTTAASVTVLNSNTEMEVVGKDVGGGGAKVGGEEGSGRLTAQEAIEMLQKILVISNAGGKEGGEGVPAAGGGGGRGGGGGGESGGESGGGGSRGGGGDEISSEKAAALVAAMGAALMSGEEEGEEEKEGKEMAASVALAQSSISTLVSPSELVIPDDDVLSRDGEGKGGRQEGLALRPVGDPLASKEEGDEQGTPRSPLPFVDAASALLRAQGVTSPFQGGPRGEEVEGEGMRTVAKKAAAAVAEKVVEELLSHAMEGETVLEEVNDEGEEEGDEMEQGGKEEEERMEGYSSSSGSSSGSSSIIISSTGTGGTSSTSASTNSVVSSSYPPPPSPPSTSPCPTAVRSGIGGSRQQCALPDHRVQAGCTSVVALLVDNDLVVANAGDSRAVLCRKGTAIALSEDHKPLQDRELERIRRAGGFVTEQGRVNGNLNLSRSIGDLKYKGNTALPAKDQMISAEPDLARISLTPDDEFLVLACDGVWDCMTNQECVDFVRSRLQARREEGREGEPLSRVAGEVVDACLADDPRKTTGIGGDNMTCLIVQVDERVRGKRGGVRRESRR